MGKSSKASRAEAKDRRAVVEQMRREQQRKEKRRTYAIVGACAVVGLIIIGAGLYPVLKQNQAAAGDLETLGVAASEAGCQDVVKKPASGQGDHRPVGERIFYESAPPAFGPHGETTQFLRRFYTADERPDVESLVHHLEHGHSILWYDETVADDQDLLNVVRGIAEKFPNDADPRNKFIAAPWTADDGPPFPEGAHVALSHWSYGATTGKEADQGQGILQYCEQPSGEVVADFMADYPYTDSPEPNGV